MAEILCEALPQVVISATYLVTKGLPWERAEGKLTIDSRTTLEDLQVAGKTWIPFISGIWSMVMIIIGTVTGAMAGRELEQNLKKRRREELENKIEIKLKRRELTKVWNTGDDDSTLH